MHGEERHAELRHALDTLGDRVLDVVQLHVEEHALAGADQAVDERKSAREGKLIADLVEGDRVAEPLDHRVGLFHRRQVERDDQAVTGSSGKPFSGFLLATPSQFWR